MQKPSQGTVVAVATSLQAETLTLSAATVQVADVAVYKSQVVRITAGTDLFYRLDGNAATGADPDIPLASGAERYEYVPWSGGLSFYGTGNVTVVLMG